MSTAPPTGHPRTPDDNAPTGAEATDLRMMFAPALRNARRRAGFSQAVLAERVRVDPRTVERLEAGQLRPTPSMLTALAHALTVHRPGPRRPHRGARAGRLHSRRRRDVPACRHRRGIQLWMRRLGQATHRHLRQLQAERAGCTTSRLRRGAGTLALVSPRGVAQWLASAAFDRR